MGNVRDVKPKMTPITLDKDRHIHYDLNSFAELEELYGSVEESMKILATGSLKAVRNILWAGLIHEEHVLNTKGKATGEYNITPMDVGSWVKLGDLESLAKQLQSAIEAGLPKVAADVNGTQVTEGNELPTA